MRLDAAKAAAPYVHPRLVSVDLGNRDDKPFEISVEERERQTDQRRREAAAIIEAAFAAISMVDKNG